MIQLMWVYVANEVSKSRATVKGGCWKPVLCEHCGAEWAYHYTTSAYHATSGNQYEAYAGAQYNLESKLARVVSPVACPSCGRYQAPMVDILRARQGGWLGVLGLVGVLVGSIIGGLASLVALIANASAVGWLSVGGPSILVTGGGVFAYVMRARRRRRYDPNLDAASRAGRPSGAVHVMTREQWEKLAAEAAANNTQPPPPIAWVGGPRALPAPDGDIRPI